MSGVGSRGCSPTSIIIVVLAVLFILYIATPNIHRIPGKAKEAEVKQNLHAIQLALERYATDHDGNYPQFLYGGDSLFNIGTVNALGPPRTGGIGWDKPIQQPFDMMWCDTDTWNYSGSPDCKPDWEMLRDHPDRLQAGFGDVLSYEGYLPKYPKNPFQQGHNAKKFSIKAFGTKNSQWAGYGGREGKLVINIGWWGEVPQLMLFGSGSAGSAAESELTRQNHVPGSFYYHPRFADGATNRGHLEHQLDFNPGATMPGGPTIPPLDDSADVLSDVVAGYNLFAIGSVQTTGQDFDNAILLGADHIWRTGYPIVGQERNPWVRSRDYVDAMRDYGERPYSDGFPDFYIIHLGSGMDKRFGQPDS